MSYESKILTVMIASPSDVKDACDAVERAIHHWSDAAGKSRGVTLKVWRYDKHAVPVLGDDPQAVINKQGVDKSDIVFVLFGARVGSPTPRASSGTVEEFERALAAGKLVHAYFSSHEPLNDVEAGQLRALRELQGRMRSKWLLGEYEDATYLEHEVFKAIEHDIAQLAPSQPASAQPADAKPVRKGVTMTGIDAYGNGGHGLAIERGVDADISDVRSAGNGGDGVHLFGEDEDEDGPARQ